MDIKERIYERCETQPEGLALLDTIKVKKVDVITHYMTCRAFKAVVDIKFDIDKLDGSGYTLNEILNMSDGILNTESYQFVLRKLNNYISAKGINLGE